MHCYIATSHHHRDMVIHVFVDIAQKAGGHDTDHAKRDASQIYILIAFRVSHPARNDDHLIGRLVPSNPGYVANAIGERYGSELDGSGDVSDVCDVKLRDHDAADVRLEFGGKFRYVDIGIGGVADRAADDADRERQCRDSGDQVVGADDGRDDGRGHHNATDAQPGEDQESPQFIQVVGGGCSETTAAGCHKDRGDYHELFVVAVGAQEPQDDAGAGHDAKAEGEAADADANGIMAVDIEGLRRPEHQSAEEVGTGDKCDDQGQGKDSRFSLQAGREHRIPGAIGFPDAEGSNQASP